MLVPRQVASLSIHGGNECPECAECVSCLKGTDDHWYLSWASLPEYSLLQGWVERMMSGFGDEQALADLSHKVGWQTR